MDKKIYYISDWHVSPGHYSYERHRFPQAYIELAPWYILNWRDIPNVIKGTGNIIVINTPVHDELAKLKIADSLTEGNEVYIVQEGSVWDWLDWSAPEQEMYIKILSKAKAYLCSNEYEKRMMKVFIENSIKVPPCTRHFAESAREHLGNYVFIVNPCKGYQRGMISHKLVYDSVPKELEVYTMHYDRTPHIGRMLPLPDSYSMPGFKKLNYMQHDEFLSTAYTSRFGVDIHRDFSAGQTAVDFGSLGVPMVGNIQLDAQRNIFPDTSFEWDDYEGFKKCIKTLSTDDEFCKEVGRKALENVQKTHLSTIVVETFKNEFNTLRECQTESIK
jgi:hypothetical protein